MERASTYDVHMDIRTHLVLELLNHITETLRSRADFGIVEAILDVHRNSVSILQSYQVDRRQMPNLECVSARESRIANQTRPHT
jgi:hypothetical protein